MKRLPWWAEAILGTFILVGFAAVMVFLCEGC